MKTFNKAQKQQLIEQLEDHYKQDEIIHGVYWEDGKGCAVGCISHDSETPHETSAMLTGTPLWMHFLVDTLFEGMPNKKAKEFPLRFIKAIPTDINTEKLEVIRHKLALFQLNEICQNTDHEKVKDAIEQIKSLHQIVIDGGTVTQEEWSAAESAAWSAVESAAWSAAWSAESAAWSAWSAESAESAADSAVYSAAESDSYEKIANKLIQLLEAERK